MKKQLVYSMAFALCALTACDNTPRFRVEGAITEGADQTLYFEEAALDGIKVLDSVRLDNKGHFAFTGKHPDGPEFYRLRVDNKVINLGIDSIETVTVTAQLPTMTTAYSVEGSEESTKIKELVLRQMGLQDRIRTLVGRGLPPGDLHDSIDVLVEQYKQDIKRQYIYAAPQTGYAYYALFQRINGTMVFNPESNRDDVRCYAAVATSWDLLYPHSLRATNLHNIAMRGMKNTRKVTPQIIPEELISEVSLFDLSLPDLRGNLRTLTELKGKVVLLDFTLYQNQASPARNLALRELYNSYAAQGLEIYQVSFDPDEHFWKTSADNLPWICVRDAEGRSATTYRVTDLPTYFLIDRANGLYKRSSDIKDTEELKKEITKLLSGV